MADFQIQSNSGRYWATGNVKQIQGQRALGFYRMTFLTQLNVASGDPATDEKLTSMLTDISAGGRTLGRASAQPHQLPIVPRNYPQEPNLNFELDLDRARLEAIEDVRNGGDVAFNVTFFPTLTDHSGEVRQTTAQAAFVANQSTWAAVLDQMDYRKTMLVEVPVPDAAAFPALAAAAATMAQAQQAMTRGDYRQTVALCRDMMDQINQALNDDDNLEEFANLKQKSKADRVRLLRRALRVFTHPAHHPNDAENHFDWNRIDAASTISIGAALLNEIAGAPGAR